MMKMLLIRQAMRLEYGKLDGAKHEAILLYARIKFSGVESYDLPNLEMNTSSQTMKQST